MEPHRHPRTRVPDSCDFTVFGGTGDLALRKLLPALYLRDLEGQLPGDTRIIGVSRAELDDAGYRDEVRTALDDLRRPRRPRRRRRRAAARPAAPPDARRRAPRRLAPAPRPAQGPAARRGRPSRVFYLAVAPAALRLDLAGTSTRSASSTSAPGSCWRSRSATTSPPPWPSTTPSARSSTESQIFRIDHYLGKESVQNLLVTRFANTFLEPLWNSRWVDHVQITVAESLGVGERGGYYDHAGAMRDMVQNHLLQLLCLVAMEPPTHVGRETVRDEKLKVLQALKPMTPADVDRDTVRGRYDRGARRRRAPSRRTPRTSGHDGQPHRDLRRAARPRCRTGAGPACRSTCAPASGWTAAPRRSSWSSRRRRTRCSRTARASPSRTGCTSRSSPTRACACT